MRYLCCGIVARRAWETGRGDSIIVGEKEEEEDEEKGDGRLRGRLLRRHCDGAAG